MKYLTLILLCLSCCIMAGGSKEIEQRHESLTMNKVIFVDHDLNRVEFNEFLKSSQQIIKVSLQKVGSRRTDTGSLEVWTVLKNHTDYDLQVQARAMFFDGDEVPIDDQSVWKRLYIPANSFATYREFSVSPLADYYIVELREGK